MAKSSLMKLLRQAYRLVQMSKKTGIPTDELVGRLQAANKPSLQLNRRRFVQLGLGAASAIAATTLHRNQPVIAQPSAVPPILIVGAGIAGLTVGYRLAQIGVPINIIEARNRVGGRIRTLPKAAGTPLYAELGGEFINSDHTNFINLAQELGFRFVDLEAADAGLIPETYFFAGTRIPLADIVRDFVPVAEQVESDLAALENFVNYTTPDEAALALDSISLADYLDGIPTSPIIRQLLRIAYTIEFGLDAEEQSPLNLIYYIGTDPNNFALFGESDERFYIDGGNQQVPQRLAELLADSIELGTALEAISTAPNGGYQVSLKAGNRTFNRTYQRVVLTVPFSVLRNVEINVDLPPVKRQAIETVGYGTNSKLVTGYSQKIWRTQYNSNGTVFTDIGFQNTWETSSSRYSPGTVGLITNYTGGTQGVAIGAGTAESQAQKFRSQFDLVFPGSFSVAIPNQSARAYWLGDRYSQGSYLCYRPGEFTRFYGVEGERVENLFFAGEHCSLEYQGFMEGGCETGESVAIEILDDVGLKEIAESLRAKMQFNRSMRRGRSRRPGARKIR